MVGRKPLIALAASAMCVVGGQSRAFAAAEYRTRLFVVCWDDGEAYRGRLDARPPYLELGSL